MGNSICCVSTQSALPHDESPRATRKRTKQKQVSTDATQLAIEKLEEDYSSGEETQVVVTDANRQTTFSEMRSTTNLNSNSIVAAHRQTKIMPLQTNQSVNVTFHQNVQIPIVSLSFSQRKRKGFRNLKELDHRRVLVCDACTVKVYGYSHDITFTESHKFEEFKEDPDVSPFLVIEHDVAAQSEDAEQILFCGFFSDSDPSLLLLLTFSQSKQCSYLKVLKIFNSLEQDEDWSNISTNPNNDHLLPVEKTYSMVEDEAREAII